MPDGNEPIMNGQMIVRKLMKMKGYNQRLLAEKIGLKYHSNVSEMLRSKNMRVDNFVMLLEAMDCEVVVRSKTVMPREDDPTRTYRPEYVVKLADRE